MCGARARRHAAVRGRRSGRLTLAAARPPARTAQAFWCRHCHNECKNGPECGDGDARRCAPTASLARNKTRPNRVLRHAGDSATPAPSDARPAARSWHELDRKCVSNVQCALCHTVQPVAESCLACGTSFGRYTCLCAPRACCSPCRCQHALQRRAARGGTTFLAALEERLTRPSCSLFRRRECRFYDDDVRKGQFHCDKCGICRVGGRDNFFHVR